MKRALISDIAAAIFTLKFLREVLLHRVAAIDAPNDGLPLIY